jgi:hypothetical protein
MRPPHTLPTAVACGLVIGACGSASKPSPTVSRQERALEFSQCMRAHGVSNFPDPSGGSVAVNPNEGQSPTFQSAQEKCGHLMPPKGPPPHMTEGELSRAFAFAKCMRAHGVPSFPDPTGGTAPTHGGPTLVLQGMLFKVRPDMGLLKSPAFHRSVERCGVRLP